MSRRIQVTLRDETVHLLEQMVHVRERSRLIDAAICQYVDAMTQTPLQQRLKEGAIKRAARDLALADEWFTLEEEVWPNASA